MTKKPTLDEQIFYFQVAIDDAEECLRMRAEHSNQVGQDEKQRDRYLANSTRRLTAFKAVMDHLKILRDGKWHVARAEEPESPYEWLVDLMNDHYDGEPIEIVESVIVKRSFAIIVPTDDGDEIDTFDTLKEAQACLAQMRKPPSEEIEQ